MREFRGKVAFITGGASGIGLSTAHTFVDAGMKVVLADLRQDHIDEALAGFERRNQRERVHAIRSDVTDREAMAAAADETERIFGKLHVLFNNAGVGIQGPFDGITYADWDFGLAVNLGGVINGLQTFLPRIRAHGEGGYVINTSSLSALVPMPARCVIYVTAKAAVIALSETIHADLKQQNIGVSVLCPGPVHTNIHETTRNRPARFAVGDAYRAFEEAGSSLLSLPNMMQPADIGPHVLKGMLEERLYIITHAEWREQMRARQAAVMQATPEFSDLRNCTMKDDSV